jgi:hypothetical protein
MVRAPRWAGVISLSLSIACGGGRERGDDDGDGDGDGSQADDGGGAAADASGGDGAEGGDAGHPDGGRGDGGQGDPIDAAGPDASTADAAGPGLVTFTFEVGAPWRVSGQRVFFLRRDDSVIDIALTDESGRAQALFDEPGSVVLLARPDQPGARDIAVAYLDVPPGSDIYFGAPRRDRTGTLTATGPSPESPVGFGLETTCGRSFSYRTTPTATVQLAYCPSLVDVVWTAVGRVDGQERTFSAYHPSVPVDAGSITVTEPLRPDVFQSNRVAGLPDVPYFDGNYTIESPNGWLQQGEYRYSAPMAGGSAVWVDPLHDLRDQGLRGRIHVQFSALLDGQQIAFDVAATVVHDGSPSVDVAGLLPPRVPASVLDRASGVLSWTEEGGTPASALHAVIFFDTTYTQSPVSYWRVIAPPDGTSVRVPRLPPPYDDRNIDADAPLNTFHLELVTHTRGYRGFLADIEGAIWGSSPGQLGDIVTVSHGFNPVVR